MYDCGCVEECVCICVLPARRYADILVYIYAYLVCHLSVRMRLFRNDEQVAQNFSHNAPSAVSFVLKQIECGNTSVRLSITFFPS